MSRDKRLNRTQEVNGSSPFSSTNHKSRNQKAAEVLAALLTSHARAGASNEAAVFDRPAHERASIGDGE